MQKEVAYYSSFISSTVHSPLSSLSDTNSSVGVRELFQIATSPTFPIRFF